MKIRNTSRWPTPALQVILEWVVEKEGITWPYIAHFGVTRRRTLFGNEKWRGRGSKHYQIVFLGRRYRPPTRKWPWLETYDVPRPLVPIVHVSRFALLCHIIFHEAKHATTGNPDMWRMPLLNRGAMEHHCECDAVRLLGMFSQDWPAIRSRIYAAMRADRTARRTARRERLSQAAKSFTLPSVNLRASMQRLKEMQ